MHRSSIKLERVRSAAARLKGDPRAVFYGEPVEVSPEAAADSLGQQAPASEVIESAIVEAEPDESLAAKKLAGYMALPNAEKASKTLLPPLACWNALVILNPMLGKVLGAALDYMLLQALNDYPYKGKVVTSGQGSYDADAKTWTLLIEPDRENEPIAVPFFRFVIASSTLNAAPGAQVSIDIRALNKSRAYVDTKADGYTYSFQRLSNTEAVVGVFIPTKVVATRTMPFLAIADGEGSPAPDQGGVIPEHAGIEVVFTGVNETDSITLTVPGYATAELKEIAAMYNLPSGMIR